MAGAHTARCLLSVPVVQSVYLVYSSWLVCQGRPNNRSQVARKLAPRGAMCSAWFVTTCGDPDLHVRGRSSRSGDYSVQNPHTAHYTTVGTAPL
ncbi:hypothetical protein F4824DRAFT_478654 [Ustulina deusta]|nr:hypothetical protein F4823DRAFT_608468 [Ustulina deusta]KAI3330447.1 hypothetical protein F4824DRAFT_478654 [Ustulina deusta]